MLRNELGDYLSNVSERDLDLPFLLLLPAMGFHDVHYVHGAVEFGKDFIAKKRENGQVVQYAFQSKAGDIGLNDWRSNIHSQLLSAATNPLPHPNFDTALPLQVVFVTTGELRGNVKPEFRALNDTLVKTLGLRPVQFWGATTLLDHFMNYGLSGIHHTSGNDQDNSGPYLQLYGAALQGTISTRDVESYSRVWINSSTRSDRHLLRCAVEAEMLVRKSVSQGRNYEACYAYLALLRALFAESYSGRVPTVVEAYRRTLTSLHDIAAKYVHDLYDAWNDDRNLLKLGPMVMNTYLVHCSRIVEMTCLAYFSSNDPSERSWLARFLDDFVLAEPGCCHPLSDRYAISLVVGVLALTDARRTETARQLVKGAAVWVCDRYVHGMGLGALEANEIEETRTLFGYAFDFIELPRHGSSFLATALGDLAAFVDGDKLYCNTVNDFQACDIHPQYWQPEDTLGVFSIGASDVYQYTNINFHESVKGTERYGYADHLRNEPDSFQFVKEFGAEAAILLMVLLRDRYFPKIWPNLIGNV